MQGSITDEKNIALVGMIYRLRQNIDIHRLIGMHVSELKEVKTPQKFLAHVQQLALSSLVIDFCKIYEFEARYPLNSISGIIKSLSSARCSENQIKEARIYSSKYGIKNVDQELVPCLHKAYDAFSSQHKKSLSSLTRRERRAFCSSSSEIPAEVEKNLNLIKNRVCP